MKKNFLQFSKVSGSIGPVPVRIRIGTRITRKTQALLEDLEKIERKILVPSVKDLNFKAGPC